MAYNVVLSLSAEQDMDRIFSYITIKLDCPKAASDLADAIDEKFLLLEEQPYMFELSRDERLHLLGYRRVVIDNYVLMYTIDDTKKQVLVARIFYGKQSYEKYL